MRAALFSFPNHILTLSPPSIPFGRSRLEQRCQRRIGPPTVTGSFRQTSKSIASVIAPASFANSVVSRASSDSDNFKQVSCNWGTQDHQSSWCQQFVHGGSRGVQNASLTVALCGMSPRNTCSGNDGWRRSCVNGMVIPLKNTTTYAQLHQCIPLSNAGCAASSFWRSLGAAD